MKHHPQTTLSALIFALALVASSPLYSVAADTNAPERAIVTKAKSIVVPEFKLDGVTLSEAVHQLSIAARQNAHDGQGVNFMVTEPAMAAANPKITLALKNVTLAEATERLAQSAGVFVTAEDFAFVFRPKTDLGAVELVAGKPAQFSLGAGKWCKIFAGQLPNAIHLKLEILATNEANAGYIIQSLHEMTTLPGKRCDILLGDTMVSIIPTLKTP